jgi:transposase InsO family protein
MLLAPAFNRAKLDFEQGHLWCADYKGEFMLADRRYCYPLTITDFASRYLFVYMLKNRLTRAGYTVVVHRRCPVALAVRHDDVNGAVSLSRSHKGVRRARNSAAC